MYNYNTLPDYLPGNPPMYGVKQESPHFDQGVDITFEVRLKEGYKVVKAADYILHTILKDSLYTNTVIWQGKMNYGISVVEDETVITIPRSITVGIPSGIYYVAVIGTSKENLNHSVVLWKSTLGIEASAASPYSIVSQQTNINEIPDSVLLPSVIVPINYNF